ncbi:MAG: DUF1588 domain-containing protein, partial [Myxococcota bacterium]
EELADAGRSEDREPHDDPSPPPSPREPQTEAHPSSPSVWVDVPPTTARGLVRLTPAQIDSTLQVLLSEAPPPASFPSDARGHFDNDGGTLGVSRLWMERAIDRAQWAAEQVQRRVADLAPYCAEAPLGECARSFVDDFVAQAWRRPLRESERERLVALAVATSEETATALKNVTVAALISVPFLYRDIEVDAEGTLSAFEIAQRLSYFLRGGPPSEPLREAARSGGLEAPSLRWQWAERILDSPQSVAVCVDILSQLLHLEELPSAFKSPELFPAWDDALPAQMGSEMQYVFTEWCSGHGTIRDLFTVRTTHLPPLLAERVYGRPGEFRGELPEGRAGVLARAGFLALHGVSQSRPVLRGLTIRERLLCDLVPNPPSSVDATPPAIGPMTTTRQRFEDTTAAADCSACHQLMDPLGYAAEGFDAMGRARTHENGLPVDTTGTVVGADLSPFADLSELQRSLAGSRHVHACLARQWFRYGLARSEDRQDLPDLDRIWAGVDDGSTYRDLVRAVVTSPAFIRRHPPGRS